MKEVACAVCGAVYRFAPADIPPAGKTLTCAKCKARVVVPGSDPMAMAGGKGDVIDLGDLPGPRRVPVPSPLAPRSGNTIDLPMPSLSTADLGLDLPPPKRSGGGGDPLTLDSIDLLAPIGSSARAPAGPPAVGDPIDLPTGDGTGREDVTDLPAPKRSPDIADLPAPKRSPDVADLPAPKRSPDVADLPAPKGPPSQELAPKGPPSQELAPKGFFADLPQPKGATPTQPQTQDVAPKGFFADLPQPKGATTSAQEVAPKGFFDDLPVPKHAASASIELESRLPAPTPPPARASGAPRAPTLDLDSLDLAPPSSAGELELEPAVASARQAGEPGPSVPRTTTTVPPPLELGGDADALAGLDLPSTGTGGGSSPARGGVVAFKPTGGPELDIARGGAGGDLDLAGPAGPPRGGAAATATTDATARKKQPVAEEKRGLSKKMQRLILVAALALAAVGAGGYFMFQRYQAKEQRAADIRAGLAAARRAMADGNKNSWQRGLSAARQVLALDQRNAEGLGLAAQALLAGYLDEGTQRETRLSEAQKHLAAVPDGAGRAPEVERAIALNLIVEGNPDASIARLKPLADRKDADAILFLGWAYLAAGQWDEASAAFQASLAASPRRAVTAKYGLARAQLGKGDRGAARATFLEVIALDKDHVGALVGEAEAMPANEFVQQETALLAILQRKGIDAADPRVVARAWTVAGDDARRAGRLDQARGYYRKALALTPAATDTLVSSAALELRDGKLDDAAQEIEKALSLAPADVAANLVAAELDIKRGAMATAAQRLASLETRTPPLAGSQLGRLHLLQGRRAEAEDRLDDALVAYENAGKVLGEDDVQPAIATAMVLGRLANAARARKDEPGAKELEARAGERLGRLAAAAEQDPSLAVTLGVAYLAAGSAKESETWLRKALAKRPADVEATYQLAEALRRQGKQDEALATLSKAYELEPQRIDLGVELARAYEAAGRDANAASLYKKLVATPGVSIDVRVRAGRFFARTGDMDATRQEAEEILAVEPSNAAGLFLRAEGLMADGHHDDARRLYQQAIDSEAEAQYWDGLGRASEAIASKTGDTARRDEALRAYLQASEKDPKMLNPRLGRGRLHMQRLEHQKAMEACQEALALAPNEASIPHCIGMSYAALGEKAKAVEWLTRAVRIKETGDAYNQLGIIFYEMGDKGAAAASALTRATRLGVQQERDTGETVPWLTDAYWMLGDVERLRSRSEQCRAWLAYLERAPTNKVQADEVRRQTYDCR